MGLTRTRLLALLLPILLVAAAGGGYALGSRTASDAATGTGDAAAEFLPPPSDAQARTVEIGFPSDMIDHHDQIVGVASFASAHATSDMVRLLANDIVASQQYEKGLLESYLRARGVNRPSIDGRTTMAWMGTPVALDAMPGYLPKADVVELYNLTGADFDRRFLELTIRHHEGGLHMAEDAKARSTDPWLRDLAGKMVVAQQEEINDATVALNGG